MDNEKFLPVFTALGDANEHSRCLAAHGLIRILQRACSNFHNNNNNNNNNIDNNNNNNNNNNNIDNNNKNIGSNNNTSNNNNNSNNRTKGEERQGLEATFDYTLQRLARGLASDRECVRIGYCMALTQILKIFTGTGNTHNSDTNTSNINDKYDIINVRNFIETIVKPLFFWENENKNKGENRYGMMQIPSHSREANLCELFICKAIIESGVFLNNNNSNNNNNNNNNVKEDRTVLARFLTNSLKKIHDTKMYLQDAVTDLFIAFIEKQLIYRNAVNMKDDFALAQ